MKKIRISENIPEVSAIALGCRRITELDKTLERIAEKYHATPNAIAVAWIISTQLCAFH